MNKVGEDPLFLLAFCRFRFGLLIYTKFDFHMLPIEIEDKRSELAAQVEKLGAELLEIRFRRSGAKSTLTFIVDKTGGVTLEDCAQINRRLGDFFGGQDIIAGSYYLEVSSPGLDRPLKSPRDFVRAMGQKVRITAKDESGKIRTWSGEVEAVEEGAVSIRSSQEGLLKLKLDSIVKAVREIRFK